MMNLTVQQTNDKEYYNMNSQVGSQGAETMTQPNERLPSFLAEPFRIGQEISVTGKWIPSVTGKWIPTKKGGLFRKSTESKEMLKEWDDIHADAKGDAGVLSTEINHAVGEDAVLVHHVFKDPDALVHYFSTTATQHMGALTKVAKPELHLFRGVSIPAPARDAVLAKNVPGTFGEFLFGYVKEEYKRPDLETAIMVTAKWTCKPGVENCLEDLKYWWQRVGTDAHSMEEGLLRSRRPSAISSVALSRGQSEHTPSSCIYRRRTPAWEASLPNRGEV
jgi:hypothetical protein